MTEDLEPPKKKRKKTKSPTARTLEELRKRGYVAQVVEKWNMHAKVLQDLFGCIDVVAIGPEGIIGVQATSGQTGGNHSNRRTKMLAEPRAKKWLEAGGKLWLWSWAQRGARDERKLWTLRAEELTLADFAAAAESEAA
jgi:hypothetical protein